MCQLPDNQPRSGYGQLTECLQLLGVPVTTTTFTASSVCEDQILAIHHAIARQPQSRGY